MLSIGVTVGQQQYANNLHAQCWLKQRSATHEDQAMPALFEEQI
jgi:hypothetical protein